MKLLDATHDELTRKLKSYLELNPLYRAVFDYTKQRFEAANNLPAHNWSHCYRDIMNAIVIGEAEGADMSIVLPAATMHDIGFLYGATGKTHGAIGADHLETYLKQGSIDYPVDVVAKIADCIRTHKGSMHQEIPKSLEAKVVADADMLEKFGPFGIYQNIRTFTEFNYPLEKILQRGTEIFNLTLETPTGRRIAEPGGQFVADFYKELQEANEPYGDYDIAH
jgi:hypothetical protein